MVTINSILYHRSVNKNGILLGNTSLLGWIGGRICLHKHAHILIFGCVYSKKEVDLIEIVDVKIGRLKCIIPSGTSLIK